MNNQRIVVSLNLKRTIKIMKLTVLMLAVCLSSVVASTYAQTATLNVSAKNETLEKVLKQIEKQSEFLFFYNLEEINKNEKISINEKNANIQTVLDAIAAKTGLKYTIKDRHIVLTSEAAPASTAATQQNRKVTGTVSDASALSPVQTLSRKVRLTVLLPTWMETFPSKFRLTRLCRFPLSDTSLRTLL